MSKLPDRYLGICASLLVTVGLLMLEFVWMPRSASAAPSNGYDDRDLYSHSGVCAAIHRVALGENLSTIAVAYGVTVGDLVLENALDDTNLIYENQPLCIPVYSSIAAAEKYGYTSHNRSPESGSQEVEDDYQDEDEEQDYSYRKPGIAYDPGDSYGSRSYGNQVNGEELQPGTSRWSSE